MFNHRFTSYIVGIGIIVCLSVSYFGYRAYQRHVEFEAFISGAKTFQQSIDKDSLPNVDQQIATRKKSDALSAMGLPSPDEKEFKGYKSMYKSRLDPSTHPVKVKLDGNPRGMIGEVERIPASEIEPEEDEGVTVWTADEMVPQLIELPNGHVIEVLSVPGEEIQEGEAASLEELGARMAHRVTHIEMGGISYEVPIDVDPDVFDKKVSWAHNLQVPIEEIDRLIANGELIIKLDGSPRTPEELAINRKLYAQRAVKNKNRLDAKDQVPPKAAINTVSEGVNSEDARRTPVHDDASLSTSDKSVGELTPSRRSEPRIETSNKTPTPLTTESIETQLRERLSPERFDKAKQLFDQYGTVEGLRRLREMDPEAARQFERGHPPQSPREQGQGSRTVPDGEQSESGSKD